MCNIISLNGNTYRSITDRTEACDPNSRCFYCREWAQYIYKKHFVWNAKTQEDINTEQHHLGSMSTGHYSICMLQTTSETKRKEESPKLSEQFEKLLEAKASIKDQEDNEEEEIEEDNDTNDENESTISLKYSENKSSSKKKKREQKKISTESASTLTQDIIQACILWQSLPSSLSGLPSIFEPVQFNPFPDYIPLDDDLKAPAQLLDPLIIERQALCLPSEGFHLLKNLTGDILLSHTQPSCHHVKPDDSSPADLELERQVLNDELEMTTSQALDAIDKRLVTSWKPLLDFLYQLGQLEEQRDVLMGKQCQATVDAFVEKQQLLPFTKYWHHCTVGIIKKKNQENDGELHHLIDTYLDTLTKHVQSFLDDFVKPRLEQIGRLIQNLWDLVGPTIQHMAERMATHEERDKGNAENCKAVSQSLKGLHSTKEVDEAIDRIQHAMADRVNEYVNNVQQLKQSYSSAADLSTKSILERVAQKDFKKKTKKLEIEYSSLRKFFRYEVSQKIFPETLFCKFSLVCLGALMQEGEVMEAMIIETEVKRFIESHRMLVKRRQAIILQYEEGVQVGRRELAGILGKLFLKEGMRIQGENLALKRQNMLLKSMGVGDTIPTLIEKEHCHSINDLPPKSHIKENVSTSKKDDSSITALPLNPLIKQQNNHDHAVPSIPSSRTITTLTSPSLQSLSSSTTTISQKQKPEPSTIKKKNKVFAIITPTPFNTVPEETAVLTPKEHKTTLKSNISTKSNTLKLDISKTVQSPLPLDAFANSSTTTTEPSNPGIITDISNKKSDCVTPNTIDTTLDLVDYNNSEKNTPLTMEESKGIKESKEIKENKEQKQQIEKYINTISQLQQDKKELETEIISLRQQMVKMEQHYTEKIKEQNHQTRQLYEQQQKENQELQSYAQQLELQNKLIPHQFLSIKNNSNNGIPSTSSNSISLPSTGTNSILTNSQLYSHNYYQQLFLNPSFSSSPSSSSPHWLSTGFGNQDLFAGYRQEMQSSSSPSFHPPPL
ncbi:unnamed protein product [Cunninghamella blakesleeana]